MDLQQEPQEIQTLIHLNAQRSGAEEGSVGFFLRVLRKSRRASLAEVAERAKIARSTLNRWELGTHRPYLPELEAVLKALDASHQEWQQALALVGAPRAHQRLRQEINERANAVGGSWLFVAGSGSGNLLRALRHRQGLSQEQVTERLGIPRQTLSRWETGETALPVERAEELLRVLGARDEESAALISGRLSLPSFLAHQASASLEELHGFLYRTAHSPEGYDPANEALKELCYLTVEAHITPLALQHAAARALLVEAYACHAHWLSNNARPREAARYTERALELARQERLHNSGWLRAVLVSARIAVFGGRHAKPVLGIEMLNSPVLQTIKPLFESWILRDLAEYLSLQGRDEPALKLSAHACVLAERHRDLIELRMRQSDHAQLLIRLGRGGEALGALPVDNGAFGNLPQHLLREHLLRSRALLLVGDAAEAHEWLDRALTVARNFGLGTEEADVLARRF